MRYFHYWYGTFTYETPIILTIRATIIKTRTRTRALEVLDERIRSYIDRHAGEQIRERRRETSLIGAYYVNRGILPIIKNGIKDFSLDL